MQINALLTKDEQHRIAINVNNINNNNIVWLIEINTRTMSFMLFNIGAHPLCPLIKD